MWAGRLGILAIEVAKRHGTFAKCTSFDLPVVEPLAKRHTLRRWGWRSG